MPHPHITLDRLNELLSYDHESGIFTWKIHRSSRVRAGDTASHVGTGGYICINIGGRIYRAHRLGWFIHQGRLPKMHLDHINTIRTDNRICNLREVTAQMNSQNMRKAHSDNLSTGMLGVSPNGKNGFMAKIYVNKKQVYLGTFRTKEEASAAYTAAKKIHHLGNTL